MLKQIFIILCEKMIQDTTGKNSYIDCFDIINTIALPIKLKPFYFCSQFVKTSPDDFIGRVKFTIKSPNGEETLVVQDEVIVKKDKHGLNVEFKDGFIFPWEGKYEFNLSLFKSDKSWEETFKTDLIIRKTTA